ncbi:Phytosulfokine [Quillaja saponaria]|uniref:Phytosulfokine n=1 Tax=Quillaja saponaria TaxID=32244 RepID=A0AAD7PVD7_QUISA|nr:Phytosulfokine [Quillaja saponaria]
MLFQIFIISYGFALFMEAVLLCFTLSYAARSEPVFPQHAVAKNRHGDNEAEMPVEMMNESYEGVGEERMLDEKDLLLIQIWR